MSQAGWSRGAAAAVLAFFVAALPASAAEPLPGLGAEPGGITVSGLSSGAYMAGQMQIAHSSRVSGAAIIAGGPYGCAESLDTGLGQVLPGSEVFNFGTALNGCMRHRLWMLGVPDASRLADRARERAELGEIDQVAGLADDRVYLFVGENDGTVARAIVEAAEAFYVNVGVPARAITLVENVGAGHAFVTESTGLSCGTTGEPYLTDCDYDQAGALLETLLGPLAPPSTNPAGRLVDFDQLAYVGDAVVHGFAPTGAVYVPDTCAATPGCRIHIVFHGCGQSRERIGDAFVDGAGYQRWADTNRLVVLFPQVSASPFNPEGCWDWWGYTGRAYLTREGTQIAAVWRMVDRLAGPADR
ncbi:MAG: poly(3-hydroxybutyrate) depolymerase [Hyphomicrobiaceae bacterium]